MFGARFLLLFVFATIPAGIVAKTQYGDILANVDVLHGSSESLLTVSNALFAYGFGAAASAEAETRDEDEREEATPAGAVLGILFATCVVSTLAVSAGASAIAGDGILASEPSNALSLPTWAVHVSSVTEYAAAMGDEIRRRTRRANGEREVEKLDSGHVAVFGVGNHGVHVSRVL